MFLSVYMLVIGTPCSFRPSIHCLSIQILPFDNWTRIKCYKCSTL